VSASERQDLLERQIRAIASMLTRVLGLRLHGDLTGARAELERARTELLGAKHELYDRLAPASAVELLGSPARGRAYADVLREQAGLEADAAVAAALEERADAVTAAAGPLP
jgi:hypothetical protein